MYGDMGGYYGAGGSVQTEIKICQKVQEGLVALKITHHLEL